MQISKHTSTTGEMLRQKLCNFIGWLQSLDVPVDDTTLHSLPDTLIVVAVQDTLLEHKELVAQRDLDNLLRVIPTDTDASIQKAVSAFHARQQHADTRLSAEALDKFWRYLDLFILLVE